MTRHVLSPASAAERDLAQPATPSRRWIWVIDAFAAVAAGIVVFAPTNDFPDTFWVRAGTSAGDLFDVAGWGDIRTQPDGEPVDGSPLVISWDRGSQVSVCTSTLLGRALERISVHTDRWDEPRLYDKTGVQRPAGGDVWQEYRLIDSAAR